MPITDNLISLRYLTEDATDAVGDNDLTNNGSVTFDADDGGAFSSGKYLSRVDDADFDFTDEFTFAARVKSSTKSEQYIAVKGTDTGSQNSRHLATGITIADGKPNLNMQGVGGWFKGTVDICDGSWHHVIYTYDGSNRYIYIDFEAAGTGDATGNITSTNSPFTVGARTPVASYAERTGNLKTLAMRNRAFNTDDVAELEALAGDPLYTPGDDDGGPFFLLMQ